MLPSRYFVIIEYITQQVPSGGYFRTDYVSKVEPWILLAEYSVDPEASINSDSFCFAIWVRLSKELTSGDQTKNGFCLNFAFTRLA